MNEQVKKMWLDALRSGDYTQGREVLHLVTEDGEQQFCCLGVLCDLAHRAGVVARPESTVALYGDDTKPYILKGGTPAIGYTYGWGGSVADLPHEVVEWAGLPIYDDDDEDAHYFNQGDPYLTDGESRTHVSWFNDNGLTFVEIAVLIEDQL